MPPVGHRWRNIVRIMGESMAEDALTWAVRRVTPWVAKLGEHMGTHTVQSALAPLFVGVDPPSDAYGSRTLGARTAMAWPYLRMARERMVESPRDTEGLADFYTLAMAEYEMATGGTVTSEEILRRRDERLQSVNAQQTYADPSPLEEALDTALAGVGYVPSDYTEGEAPMVEGGPAGVPPEVLARQRDQIIAETLRTADGRSALAASMTAPLRRRLGVAGIGRQVFQVEPLPEGAVPAFLRGDPQEETSPYLAIPRPGVTVDPEKLRSEIVALLAVGEAWVDLGGMMLRVLEMGETEATIQTADTQTKVPLSVLCQQYATARGPLKTSYDFLEE